MKFSRMLRILEFRKMLLTVVLLAVAFVHVETGYAIEPSRLVVSDKTQSERYNLAPLISYWHTEYRQLTWQEAFGNISEFTRYGKNGIAQDLGVLKGDVWFVLIVDNKGSYVVESVLEIPTGLIEEAELFVLKDGHLEERVHFQDWSDNSITVNGFARILELAAKSETTLLFRVQTRLHMQFPAYLNTGNGFTDIAIKSRLVEILFYSILIAFALYHSFLFFVNRDRADLTLVFYILVMTFELSSNQGYHQFIPLIDQYEMYWIKSVSGNLVLISFMMQLVTYLTVKQRYPRLYHFFVTSIVALSCISSPLGYFLGPQYFIACLLVAGAILIASSLYIVFHSLADHYRPARYYLAAMLCPVVGGGLVVAYFAGFLPSVATQFQPMFLLLVSIALQLMVLSLGMSERVKFLKAEHESNEQEIVLAEARSHAKGDILAQMSHEIRTPINGILGVVELIRNTKVGAYQEFLIGMMEQSGTRLLRTINNILEYSKLEAGKGKTDSVPFDLWAFLFEVMDVFSLSAARRETKLHLQFDASIPHTVIGDSDRLKKVLYELLDNAISFTPLGRGEAFLKVSWDDSLANPLHINIVDDGRGVSEEMKEQIFEDLWHRKIEKKVTTHGAGLGLTVAKRNVDMIGGDIGFREVELGGSDFWLTLPFPEVTEERSLPIVHDRLVQVIGLDPGVASPYVTILDSLSIPNQFLDEADALRRLLVGDKELLKQGNTLLVISSGLKDEVLALIKAYEMHQKESKSRMVILAEPYELKDYEGVSEFDSFAIVDKYLHPDRLVPIMVGEDNSDVDVATRDGAISVLVVDDNDVNRMVLKAGLAKHNTAVQTGVNGHEAVDLFIEGKFDLIFMDCEMPVMNGFVASKKIREYEELNNLPSTPIIALTAHLADDIRQIAIDSGMDEVMSKPIRKERLKQLVVQHGR